VLDNLKFIKKFQIPEDNGPDLDNEDTWGDNNDDNRSSPELNEESEMQIKEEEQPVEKRPGQTARVGFNLMKATDTSLPNQFFYIICVICLVLRF
jgi:hypothetical protein